VTVLLRHVAAPTPGSAMIAVTIAATIISTITDVAKLKSFRATSSCSAAPQGRGRSAHQRSSRSSRTWTRSRCAAAGSIHAAAPARSTRSTPSRLADAGSSRSKTGAISKCALDAALVAKAALMALVQLGLPLFIGLRRAVSLANVLARPRVPVAIVRIAALASKRRSRHGHTQGSRTHERDQPAAKCSC
jgi:hypothetical protein